jgi:hypothetical protein
MVEGSRCCDAWKAQLGGGACAEHILGAFEQNSAAKPHKVDKDDAEQRQQSMDRFQPVSFKTAMLGLVVMSVLAFFTRFYMLHYPDQVV